MNNLNVFCLRNFFLAALLLCSLTANADQIQDATKLFKQGQYGQALERINVYLASSPKDAQARFLKGLILTEQGKTSDAIAAFSALTDDYPELPEPYNNLAVLYASQGQYDKAKMALEMAIRTHPSYATAHENLGDIYARMASQAYDRALQLDKSNTGTQTKLALIQDLFTGNQTGKPALPNDLASSPGNSAASPVTPKMARSTATAAPRPPQSLSAANKASNTPAEIMNLVQAWAAAWSERNVERYLSFYDKDFKIPDGESRQNWQASRIERLTQPKFIKVSISNVKVNLIDDTHAVATFRQSYRSSQLKSSSRKSLLLVKSDGKWLIQEERSKK